MSKIQTQNQVKTLSQALSTATMSQLSIIAKAYKDLRLQVNATAFYRAAKMAVHSRDTSGLIQWIAEFRPGKTDIARMIIITGGYTLIQTAKGAERLFAPENSLLAYDSTTKSFSIQEVKKDSLERIKANLDALEYALVRPDQIPVLKETPQKGVTIDTTANVVSSILAALPEAE